MATRRQIIIDLLAEGSQTAKQLAAAMEMKVNDLLDDLEHIRKSRKDLKIEPARCEKCGFGFGGRHKLSTPSRCPDCRSERVAGPWLSL